MRPRRAATGAVNRALLAFWKACSHRNLANAWPRNRQAHFSTTDSGDLR